MIDNLLGIIILWEGNSLFAIDHQRVKGILVGQWFNLWMVNLNWLELSLGEKDVLFRIFLEFMHVFRRIEYGFEVLLVFKLKIMQCKTQWGNNTMNTPRLIIALYISEHKLNKLDFVKLFTHFQFVASFLMLSINS